MSQVIFNEKHIVTSRTKRDTKTSESHKIRLTTSNSEGIIVALFHSVNSPSQSEGIVRFFSSFQVSSLLYLPQICQLYDKIENLACDLVREFSSKYHKTYSTMKDQFKDLVSDIQKLPITQADVFELFKNFQKPLKKRVKEAGLPDS